MRLSAVLTGVGRDLPEDVLTNQDLMEMVETSDEWITTRTGIRERHRSRPDEYLSQFAVRASRRALAMAGRTPEELDLVICATVTPDQLIPATACFIQHELGCRPIPAFDMQAGCTGYLYALTTAAQYIETGMCQRVLVIGAELLTKYVNYEDRATCIIFGDGAGAGILERCEPPRGILAASIKNDGKMADYIQIPGGATREPISAEVMAKRRHLIQMKGNETFKVAIRSMEEVSREVCAEAGIEPSDVDLFVPHQANKRIIDAVGHRLGIPPEKVVANIDRVGNTSSASIPIALSEAMEAGRVSPGQTILMTAFGAGLTWGGILFRL